MTAPSEIAITLSDADGVRLLDGLAELAEAHPGQRPWMDLYQTIGRQVLAAPSGPDAPSDGLKSTVPLHDGWDWKNVKEQQR